MIFKKIKFESLIKKLEERFTQVQYGTSEFDQAQTKSLYENSNKPKMNILLPF